MVDRVLLWLGAGVVAGGVTVGMLAGAGMANAQTESGADGGAKTSQEAKPAANKPDSVRDSVRRILHQTRNANDVNAKVDADHDAVKAVTDVKKDAAKQSSGNAPRFDAGERTAKLINNVVAAVTHKPDRTTVVDKPDRTTDAVDAVDTAKAESQPTSTAAPLLSKLTSAAPTQSNITLATPMLNRALVTPTATAAQPIKVPPVVSAIGTAVFGLISFAESVFEGPPKVPPGSNVTVQRSTLDLGNGNVVPADWYFPEGSLDAGAPPPERIIYLQHGFLARGVFYDYTAAYLAEQTNSVVVAPTLTSNIFATDGMWLGGEQMHRAVADLFVDGNGALLESAQAAGYTHDELPTNVVLVGHSLGGGLVIDTGRFMAADEATGDSSYKLAGVLMLDGVSFTDPGPILADIPDSIPVYNLSATPYVWNLFGTMDAALAKERPDAFHGAQLLGGLHSDSMIGGNPLVQFGAYLLTGFSLPRNAEGSQILAAGWINDMFTGTPTCSPTTSCFYGQPGGAFAIPTAFGPAIALVQPQPGVVDSLARQLTALSIGLLAHINFATDAPAIQETGVVQEISTPNTALSLDGNALTRHSVGQHVCTG